MFGWNRRKRKKKGDAVGDVGSGVVDLGDAAANGCGCDLPLIALTLMAGASLFLMAR